VVRLRLRPGDRPVQQIAAHPEHRVRGAEPHRRPVEPPVTGLVAGRPVAQVDPDQAVVVAEQQAERPVQEPDAGVHGLHRRRPGQLAAIAQRADPGFVVGVVDPADVQGVAVHGQISPGGGERVGAGPAVRQHHGERAQRVQAVPGRHPEAEIGAGQVAGGQFEEGGEPVFGDREVVVVEDGGIQAGRADQGFRVGAERPDDAGEPVDARRAYRRHGSSLGSGAAFVNGPGPALLVHRRRLGSRLPPSVRRSRPRFSVGVRGAGRGARRSASAG
jgi:hypothetical protein